MPQNIIEYARQCSVSELYKMKSFRDSWNTWRNYINNNFLSSPPTANQLYDLGDHLRDTFKTTGQPGRGEDVLSAGGNCWEALICWYLNLCLIGRRTFVIKKEESLLPLFPGFQI